MTTVLCTLYNSLYLDKGLVLYDSLCECSKDFKLYVLCMDNKCYEVLRDLKQEHHIPVRLSDFEEGDEALLESKANRPMGEYCWTCSSSFIRYVLKHYNEDCCTYIDADMYFYNDPQVLIDEMSAAGKSVMVVPHRFPENKKELAKKVGTYCVEFNTFLNTPDSLTVLDCWRKRCLECCSTIDDGIHWGDQKYLEELVEKFECVHVCEKPGAGVAPWNFSLYSRSDNDNYILYNRTENLLFFVHFQGISYLTKKKIATGVPKRKNSDFRLIKNIYVNYLTLINEKNLFLRKTFGFDCMLRNHPIDSRRFVSFKETLIGSWLRYVLAKLKSKTIIVSVE